LLLVWPLACVLAAQAVLSTAAAFALHVGVPLRAAAPAAVALCAAASVVLFLVPAALSPPSCLSAPAIRRADEERQAIEAIAGRLGPRSAVVVTGTRSAESFRFAGYYLPQFFTVAVGLDREGTLGVAFRAYRGDHDYARFMLGGAAALSQPLPAGTTRLLVLDESVANLFRANDLESVAVSRWRTVWLYPAETDGALEALTFPRPLVVERR
jgi:hypothetical protein